MGLSRIGGATLLLAALSGCYQARVPAIESGDAVPFGDIASCKVRDKHLRFDLTHPEPTAGGGTIYRLGNETLAFKKLSDTLYLAQLNSSGMYRYGYVMRNGSVSKFSHSETKLMRIRTCGRLRRTSSSSRRSTVGKRW